MYAPGHVGLALLAYAPIGAETVRRDRERLAMAGLVAVAALATLPDLDLYVPWLAHRGPTHTVWFSVAVGTLLAVAVRARYALLPAAWTGMLGLVTVMVHLAGDVVTPMGLRPFAPVVDSHYTLSLVKSKNPGVNRLLLGAGGGAVGLAMRPDVPTPDSELGRGTVTEQAYRYASEDRSAAGRRPPFAESRAAPIPATPT